MAVSSAIHIKVVALAAVLGLAPLPAVAGHLTAAKMQQQYRKLETKLAHTHGAKRAQLLARLAGLDVDQAYANFQLQKLMAGSQALNLAQQHAQAAMQALATEAAHGKSKNMRKVELQFHKITFGLRGLMNIAPYQAAPRIRAVRNYFSQLRSKLLQWMFGPAPKLQTQKH